MVNLENYGVSEVKHEEMTKIEGGWIQFVVGAIVGGLIYDIISDPKGSAAAFADGYHNR